MSISRVEVQIDCHHFTGGDANIWWFREAPFMIQIRVRSFAEECKMMIRAW